jgi:murein L,D-transpeptidase YafK
MERQGDHKTPEGNDILDYKNPKSGFHRAMHISYPNAQDRGRGARERLAPGGDIMVHGIKNGFGWVGHCIDWWTGRMDASH